MWLLEGYSLHPGIFRGKITLLLCVGCNIELVLLIFSAFLLCVEKLSPFYMILYCRKLPRKRFAFAP